LLPTCSSCGVLILKELYPKQVSNPEKAATDLLKP